MNLVPKDEERLKVFLVAELARRRKDRDVKLNHPETVAYISDWCFERARDGWTVSEVRSGASKLLSREDVMEGVPEMIDMVQVEPTFVDGTKLITVHDPIRTDTAMDVSAEGDESPSDTDDGGK
jgi:urease subunit gamma